MPGSAIQRGSTQLGSGDPLTPDWPSVEGAYRISREESDALPSIPAMPIGYDDAKVILEKLGGADPPDGWVGAIQGVRYKLGGAPASPEYEDWKVSGGDESL